MCKTYITRVESEYWKVFFNGTAMLKWLNCWDVERLTKNTIARDWDFSELESCTIFPTHCRNATIIMVVSYKWYASINVLHCSGRNAVSEWDTQCMPSSTQLMQQMYNECECESERCAASLSQHLSASHSAAHYVAMRKRKIGFIKNFASLAYCAIKMKA